MRLKTLPPGRSRVRSVLIAILLSALAGAAVSNLLLGELLGVGQPWRLIAYLATFATYMALELTGALDQPQPPAALDS